MPLSPRRKGGVLGAVMPVSPVQNIHSSLRLEKARVAGAHEKSRGLLQLPHKNGLVYHLIASLSIFLC